MEADIAVIGKGLVGSAAAAWLQETSPEAGVVLIGPDEPAPGQEAHVYASHYDAARIQRIIGKDATWTQLNLESVRHYPALEQETGIRFHLPVGCLYVSPHGRDEYLSRLEEDEKRFGLSFNSFPDAWALTQALPEYRFPDGSAGMLEENPAGMISPRLLVAAQAKRMEQRGGQTVSRTVLERRTVPGGHRLVLDNGDEVMARKVLVAAGSFANFNGLLPRPLDITLKGETILLAEVSEADAHNLSRSPALLYELFHPDIDGIYLTPPLQYPDGRWYVKMGCNLCEDLYFSTLDEVQEWFRGRQNAGDPIMARLQEALHGLMPQMRFLSYQIRPCIIHRTPSLRQYIGSAGEEGLYVSAGCNGYSAMCSDALGRLSAHFVLNGTLPEGYEEELFRPLLR